MSQKKSEPGVAWMAVEETAKPGGRFGTASWISTDLKKAGRGCFDVRGGGKAGFARDEASGLLFGGDGSTRGGQENGRANQCYENPARKHSLQSLLYLEPGQGRGKGGRVGLRVTAPAGPGSRLGVGPAVALHRRAAVRIRILVLVLLLLDLLFLQRDLGVGLDAGRLAHERSPSIKAGSMLARAISRAA